MREASLIALMPPARAGHRFVSGAGVRRPRFSAPGLVGTTDAVLRDDPRGRLS